MNNQGLNNDYFNFFVEEEADKGIPFKKDRNISYSIGQKALEECLVLEKPEIKTITKKENIKEEPFEISLKKWKEIIKELTIIQNKLQKMIFEYNKEKQNNSLTNELIVDIDINIKDLKEISNEIEDMINEIFEDMIAINWTIPIISELFKVEKKRKEMLITARNYSPS